MERWRIGPSTVWLEEGIVFHEMEPNSALGVDDFDALAERVRQLAGDGRVPIVAAHASTVSADAAVRRRAAAPEQARLCSALAIVTNSKVMIVFVTFFSRFSRPPYPVKIFGDRERAIAWAKLYVER